MMNLDSCMSVYVIMCGAGRPYMYPELCQVFVLVCDVSVF